MSNEIVISGFSGRLPESSNMQQFRDNLYNGVDMMNEEPRRWPAGLHGVPKRMGKLNDADLQHFDQLFFGVHQKQADNMDPQLRILLEATYEAIVDAGCNPHDLRGSKTGVYVGATSSDAMHYWGTATDRITGYEMTGCAQSMFANRLSFSFDFKGPSFVMDTACSSSLAIMVRAIEDIRTGICESAIVAGSTIILNPATTLMCLRLGLLAEDGTCKSFDAAGSGFARAEGIVVMFLQKASVARRVYASVLNAQTNTDGFKEQGITFPDGRMQLELIRDTYASIGLNPVDVVYVEAHGTGTKVGDPQEVNALTDFFCKDPRPAPLLIGSVKSNMGHTESTAGIAGIAKMLIAMEEGVIPGNLHFKNVNPELYGIVDGRVNVVDRNTPWGGGIIGVNSFGFGGVNAHVILKSHPKTKSAPIPSTDKVPRLVNVSGRTREAVELLLAKVEEHVDDEEFQGLVNEIHSKNIPLHQYRGFTVMDDTGSDRLVLETPGEIRPIWFIYPGFGSQWAGMAKELMDVTSFRETIERCAEFLQPEGVNLIDIVTRNDDRIFDSITNCLVGIVAIQVALTDVLRSIGIVPDGMVGHSIGEINCAYADGVMTAEQAVLSAYWRGKCTVDSKPIPGMMAVVGLSWDQCQERLPADVFIACKNSTDNVTISGPRDSVAAVIQDLRACGIFTKELQNANIAFHTKYVQNAAPMLLSQLQQIIPNSSKRSTRWISSSVPETSWTDSSINNSSPEYQINNLLSPVLFMDALQHVPKNAICMEVGPRGLLQAILKRELDDKVTNLSLLERGNTLQFMLRSIGKLYAFGAQPNISKLYRAVAYPVGRGTPMLNSSIGWNHAHMYDIPKMFTRNDITGHIVTEIDLSKGEYAFIAGHRINGQVIFPASGYISLVVRAFVGSKTDKTPIVLADLVFHRQTTLMLDGASIKFSIYFLKGSGKFELCESGAVILSGKISMANHDDRAQLPWEPIPTDASSTSRQLTQNEVYKELRLRGYDYADQFCSIVGSDGSAENGRIQWNADWITFLDGMIQFRILGIGIGYRELCLPKYIGRVIIDPIEHDESLHNKPTTLPVAVSKDLNVVRSGGVRIQDLQFAIEYKETDKQKSCNLQRHAFVPYVGSCQMNTEYESLKVCVDLSVENRDGAFKLKVCCDLINNNDQTSCCNFAHTIQTIIESEANIIADMAVYTNDNKSLESADKDSSIRALKKDITIEPVERECHLVTGHNVVLHPRAESVLKNLRASIKSNGFILLVEDLIGYNAIKASDLFDTESLIQVSVQRNSSKCFVLLRPRIDMASRRKQAITISGQSFDWMDMLKSALALAEVENRYVYLVNMGEPNFGAIGFFNCIKYETGGKNARLIFVRDDIAELFDFNSPLYQEVLEKDTIVNVYSNGIWGSYRHLDLQLDDEPAVHLVEHAYLDVLYKSGVSSLSWRENQAPVATKPPNANWCEVYYAAVNTRDVIIASGHNDQVGTAPRKLGLEFAGRDSTGKRIMAIAENTFATKCPVNTNLIWEIPRHWTMEEASTVPFAYCSAYYALVMRGNMQPGDSILITNASQCVGLAAISIALSYGLTVYASVDTKSEHEFLMNFFPQLTDVIVGNSFEQFILRRTTNGVGMVLNSDADKLQAAIGCLAVNGRFLQLGEFDDNRSYLGISASMHNMSFNRINLESLMTYAVETENLANLMKSGIKTGAVRPLQSTLFAETQVEEAFSLKKSGTQMGKIVVQIRADDCLEKVDAWSKPHFIAASPELFLHAYKVYIIVGGLGGLGLELVNWMVSRGAKHFVLISRNGIRSGYQESMIHGWKGQGVHITIDTNNDVSTAKGAEAVCKSASAFGPVGGIFNLAMELRDALFENTHADDIACVAKPKAEATKCLDAASRSLCNELDFFVCFSSVACGRGNSGQTSYGMANSAMERICEGRLLDGLPGMAIQWGPIGDTGILSNGPCPTEGAQWFGYIAQRMDSCLRTLSTFMRLQPSGGAVVSSMVIADQRVTSSSDKTVGLAECIASILGLNEDFSEKMTLSQLGMDSLMCAEIRPMLSQTYDMELNISEVQQLTFGQLRALGNLN